MDGAQMKEKQMTRQEVADYFRCTPRHVQNLKGLPYSKIGRKVLYDPRDVEAFLQGAKCLSSSEPARLIGRPKSSSKACGLSEALAQAPSETPSNSNVRSAISFGAKLRSPSARQRLRLTKPPADIG
jgi:hypothetical protein